MRVTVRVDAGLQIGGGHAMRCLTLADALAEQGHTVTFVTSSMPGNIAARIARSGHRLERIAPPPDIERAGANWHERPLSREAQAADVQAIRAVSGAADWLVVDHYLLDSHWHSRAREFARHLLVIDDVASREYDCDLLLDQTFGRSAQDYRPLVPPNAMVLTGADHALLRPEFAGERPAALARRKDTHGARRILVSLGTTDPDALTADIVDRLIAAAPDSGIDVVISPDASSLQRLKALAARNPAIIRHVGTDRMAELMRDADLAIGAAGATSWERCCLGLPSIVIVLADNQRLIASGLAAAGAHIAVERGDRDGFAQAVDLLMRSAEARARMSEQAAKVTDGRGTERVLAAIRAVEASND